MVCHCDAPWVDGHRAAARGGVGQRGVGRADAGAAAGQGEEEGVGFLLPVQPAHALEVEWLASFDVAVGLPLPWLCFALVHGCPVPVGGHANGNALSVAILLGMVAAVIISIAASGE